MTWDIAESFLNKRCFQPTDVARRFCETYYRNQTAGIDRYYGHNVVEVFAKWKKLSWNDTDDPYAAGREQFDGQGSCGNGGAMRISPVALYFVLKDRNMLIQATTENALLTHTHPDGVNGAILQSLAIWHVLNQGQDDVSSPFNALTFLDQLIEDMKPLESGSSEAVHPYTTKLLLIKQYLSTIPDVSDKKIIETLGNGVRALRSVPTAIYIFLKNTLPDRIETPSAYNPFDRTMRDAVSLCGDTDTIASMAGSLAGAYYGFDEIPKDVYRHCDGVQNALQLANGLNRLVCELSSD